VRALDWLLAQDFEDFEIIVCDNASHDATMPIAATYAHWDARILLYRNPQHVAWPGNFS
jgi:glycosyltransferase involved in cell wall biosynthesis